jgi:hypothetical protein
VGGICNFGRVYLMRVSGQNITAALRNNVCTYYFHTFFGVYFAVLRNRDVYPGSQLFPSRIPDPNSFHPGFRIRIKEFKYFNPKNLFLSTRKYDSVCSSRIRILSFYPSRIQGSKGTGSRIRIRNTAILCKVRQNSLPWVCTWLFIKSQVSSCCMLDAVQSCCQKLIII